MADVDLCTVAAVREFLQKQETDPDQDDVIGSLITRASTAIIAYCQREFRPKGAEDEDRTFEYHGGGRLELTPYSLRELTSVRIDVDESNPTTLTASEYRLYPQPAAAGVYTALRLSPYLVHSRARWQQRLVEVTGKWGYDTVPSDIEHACVVTAATWLRRDVSAFSTTFQIDEARLERPEAIPVAVLGTLAPHRSTVYA